MVEDFILQWFSANYTDAEAYICSDVISEMGAAELEIIAADTVVAAGGKILGKPRDEKDAARMLTMLSDAAHEVISGVALLRGERVSTAAERTTVSFGKMSKKDVEWYVKSGEPCDKAGAYAIQGLASLFIKGLSGDYFNVVGLPVYRLNQLLLDFTGTSLAELSR